MNSFRAFWVYNERTQETMMSGQVKSAYGIDPTEDNSRLGLYHLTEQPVRKVQTYIKEGQQYKPIYDYSRELQLAQEEAALANARLDAANEQLNAVKGALEERLAALETSD